MTIISWIEIRQSEAVEAVLEQNGLDYQMVRTPESVKAKEPLLCNLSISVKEQRDRLVGLIQEREHLYFWNVEGERAS
ncbi:hypothetical protein [Brevibacillus sp. 179-C9.3 HS]|uniref:hypothetical protein n=1 Tax=unclassified Brevibacillus TaxID=2684853 RepID=UPI0039A36644